jgi:hypothetical protein
MSSISGVSPTSSHQAGVNPLVQDFNAIGSALKSGNISNAQSALSTFQKVLQNTSQTSANQPFGKNTQANMDFQSLTSDLQSGDLSGAQKAFNSLQKDLTPTPSTQSSQSAHQSQHQVISAANSTTSAATTIGGLNAVA